MKKLICLLCACLLAAAGLPTAMAGDARSLTTGRPTDRPYRPVLAEIDNDEQARPQWNLSQADIVYEMIFWGDGRTRYLALYNDNLPDEIGPVRGGRTYSAALQLAWDAPLVTVGGQDTPGTSMYASQDAYRVPAAMRFDLLQNEAQFGKYFSQRQDREAPYRHSFALRAAVENEWPATAPGRAYAPRAPHLAFSSRPMLGRRPAEGLRVVYNADTCVAAFAYNAATGLYERSYMGQPQLDEATGAQLTATNVIVQCAPVTYYKNNAARPLVETTGAGPCYVFIGGTVMQGQWTRVDMDDPCTYYVDGEVLVLGLGQTFVQMVTPDMYFSPVRDGDTEFEFVYTEAIE